MMIDIKQTRSILGQHPIAYMSAEFALDDRLPIYSGGLGVLAGDIIREANDMNLPFVGVGLLYTDGYFVQSIKDGEQHVEHKTIVKKEAPIRLIVDTNGAPIMVTIPVQNELLFMQIWEYQQGDVSVYLLDTDIAENSDRFRSITKQLYTSDHTQRILQEIVLGIGGVRALLRLHIHPSVYHLNESHSAFAIFEIIYHYMEEYSMTFDEAYEYSRKKIVFTNHTLLASGNEIFLRDIVDEYLSEYADQLGLPIESVLDYGMIPSEPDRFGLTQLALKMASQVNTVSKLHELEAKLIWPDAHMPAITNGVHLPTWVSADFTAQARWCDTTVLRDIDIEELWMLHMMAKHRLIDEIEFHTGKRLRHDHMIMTWARRMTAYKRPDLLFADMHQLQWLVENEQHPMQIVLAGKAHPQDKEGQQLLRTILAAVTTFGLENSIVFLPNYSLTLARYLVQGSDLWMNTPIRGREASGTSGMKSGANGVLQFSVSDGWVNEIPVHELGWEIDEQHTTEDIRHTLQQDILPMFYERDNRNVPHRWVEKMKQTMLLTWEQFSTRRLLTEYINILYAPSLEAETQEKHTHHWRRNYRVK